MTSIPRRSAPRPPRKSVIDRIRGRVSPQDVARLYRLLLDRDPESDFAMSEKVHRDWLDVIEEFVVSTEYRQAQRRTAARELSTRAVEFDAPLQVTDPELRELFEETRSHWLSVGTSEETVDWSVLTSDQYLGRKSSAEVVDFYRTGAEHLDLVLDLVKRVRPSFRLQDARVLDFGCGVGRVLRHLVETTAWSEGWDFSTTHLEWLLRRFAEFDIPADSFGIRALDSLDIAEPDPRFDLSFSLLTLQHNPPPLIAHLLREIFRSLTPGGIAVLHIPTVPLVGGNGFSIAGYKETHATELGLYAFPREAVLDIADRHGAQLRWSRYADWTSPAVLDEFLVFSREEPTP